MLSLVVVQSLEIQLMPVGSFALVATAPFMAVVGSLVFGKPPAGAFGIG